MESNITRSSLKNIVHQLEYSRVLFSLDQFLQ